MNVHVRRRDFIVLLGSAAVAWPIAVHGQQLPNRSVVGLLSPLSEAAAAHNVREFRKGLHDLGYVEGRNIALEFQYSAGNPSRLPELAAALVALKPDVIMVGSSSGILAASKATQTIPLVMITLESPITLGLIKTRPGTNVTGTWLAGDEALVSKRLAMLKDVTPGHRTSRRVPQSRRCDRQARLQGSPDSRQALGLDVRIFEVREASEFDAAFTRAGRIGVQALFVSQSPLFFSNRKEIAAITTRLRLPTCWDGVSSRRQAV